MTSGELGSHGKSELRLLVWQADREQKHRILERLNMMWHSTIKSEYVVSPQFPGSKRASAGGERRRAKIN